MTNPCSYRKTARWAFRADALLACLLALSWAGAAYADFQPYEARYSIYRNGKLTGMLEVELTRDGEQWAIRSEGRGTHGLARILRASDREQVSGSIGPGGRLVPAAHRRHTRVASIDNIWETTFDWDTDTVTVVHDDSDTWTLPLNGEALDPLTMKLLMRQRLFDPDPDLSFMMVEEDEIEEQNFRLLETEWLETSLGCLETVPIEKIRRKQTRYTRAWHAPVYGNVEVRVEHGKVGGDHLEMRITELSIEGQSVAALPGCSAIQSAGRTGAGSEP